MNLSTLLTAVLHWPIDPPVVIGLIITAALYWAGLRYARGRGIERRHLAPWRTALFVLALLVIFFTLDSPLDTWADTLVWAHMIQHELLTMVAVPLLLLSQPFMLIWRGVPLGARRTTLRWMTRKRWPYRTLEAIVTFLRRPAISWVIFTGLFSAWHLPWLYDAATQNDAIHAAEHICFLVTAVFFWSQVIPSLPFKPRLPYPAQAAYFALAMLWGNVLGFAFVFSTTPIYPYYAALPRAAGAISAVTDEHFAGGVMDAADTVIFISMIIVALALWLRDDEQRQAMRDAQIAASRLATAQSQSTQA
ncbi:MAG TPA: cytochrome c oxidase assembly protein [Ktedonobacterales bacterium]|nr:cytochrome c oxidase assembly protein [Ktedonobacterales bacterium]